MSDIKAVLILFGTFLPLLSFVITAALGYKFEGQRRWIALLVTPVLTMLPCYLFLDAIAANGNLLFAVTFGFAVLVYIIYYPVLLIVRIALSIRDKRKRPLRAVSNDGLTKRIY
ncbi:MAG: hypothetical protein R3F48_12045 [Candidatus Zixiibacteriota bacterium]